MIDGLSIEVVRLCHILMVSLYRSGPSLSYIDGLSIEVLSLSDGLYRGGLSLPYIDGLSEAVCL